MKYISNVTLFHFTTTKFQKPFQQVCHKLEINSHKNEDLALNDLACFLA